MNKPMQPTVVITRPIAQGAALAAKVKALGRRVELLPLLDIFPLPDSSQLQQFLKRLTDFALVAFVSPNAIEACFNQLQEMKLTWPPGVAIAVMGEGSRTTVKRQISRELLSLKTEIFVPNDASRSDSETLLRALDMRQLQARPVLIIRGQDGRDFLADALRQAGVKVEEVAAYNRLPCEMTPQVQQKLERMTSVPHDWVITSSQALRHLMQVLAEMQKIEPETQGCVANMQRQHLIVPHARIAENAAALGFSHVTCSGAGDAGILDALQSAP